MSTVNYKQKRTQTPLESYEQSTLFQWANIAKNQYPELNYLFHVPNGGIRNKVTAFRLKCEGVKPGVPDIFLDVPRHGYHGLRIELKRSSGRLTNVQADWLNWLSKQGYFATVAYGFKQAREVIEWYLGE